MAVNYRHPNRHPAEPDVDASSGQAEPEGRTFVAVPSDRPIRLTSGKIVYIRADGSVHVPEVLRPVDPFSAFDHLRASECGEF